MKAMILEATRPVLEEPLREVDLPLPTPGKGELRVQVRACAVCHTDLHIVEGDLPLPKMPVVPGHQIVGMVESLGPEAGRFRPGDRVGIPWLNRTCGQCDFCLQGNENLCDDIRFTGYHTDGGYAGYTVVSEEFACSLPDRFSDVEAAPLLCAGIIGYRSLRLSGIQPGGRVGLYGFGASAHLTIQVALHRGCEVYVFTRSSEHQEMARQMGAAWVGRAEEETPALLDSAILFAPAGRLVPEALRALKKGGILALAGIYMSPIPEMSYHLLYHERRIVSVANSTRQDAEDFLKTAADIPIRTEIETFPLPEANRALRLLKEKGFRGAGVLIVAS